MGHEKRDSLVDDASSPWHHWDDVLGQVEDSMAITVSLVVPSLLSCRLRHEHVDVKDLERSASILVDMFIRDSNVHVSIAQTPSFRCSGPRSG